MNVNESDWKEARDYSLQMLRTLIDASADAEAFKNLEQDINALNDAYSSNVYLAGMFYTYEDISVFRMGTEKERDERLSELFTHILDIIKDDEESLLPPIEIFDPMKESDFDVNLSDIDFSQNEQHIENNNNEGDTMKNTNNNTETNQNKQHTTNNTIQPEATKEKSGWCKYVLGGLGVVASGAAAYFAYNYFKNNAE